MAISKLDTGWMSLGRLFSGGKVTEVSVGRAERRNDELKFFAGNGGCFLDRYVTKSQ